MRQMRDRRCPPLEAAPLPLPLRPATVPSTSGVPSEAMATWAVRAQPLEALPSYKMIEPHHVAAEFNWRH